jgi:plastocyanin
MRTARAMMVGTLAALAACGGGGDDGGGGGTEPGVFTTLAVTPTTATVLVGGTQTLTATARDQNGATMSGLATTFTSANQAIATVTAAGVVTGVAQGSTTVAVNGTVGTVSKTQNVTVDVTVPSAGASVAATAGNQFTPATVTVTRNGSVTWTFAALHNVTFDTQGAPGNITDKASGSSSLTFPNAGTFAYHCTIHGAGMSGTVVVQ